MARAMPELDVERVLEALRRRDGNLLSPSDVSRETGWSGQHRLGVWRTTRILRRLEREGRVTRAGWPYLYRHRP